MVLSCCEAEKSKSYSLKHRDVASEPRKYVQNLARILEIVLSTKTTVLAERKRAHVLYFRSFHSLPSKYISP